MKTVLILICLIVSVAAKAQQKNEKPYKSFYEIIKEKPLSAKAEFPFPVNMHKKSTEETVKILPLDNMPCLVPDMTGFNMPVAGRNMIIPNTMPVLRNSITVR